MTSRAMAARSGETGTGSTEGNSAVANGDGPQPTDNRESIVTTSEQQAVPVAQLQMLQDWLREPDHAEHFGTSKLVEWINRRPTHIVPAVLASLAASSLHDMQITPELSHPCKSGEGAGAGSLFDDADVVDPVVNLPIVQPNAWLPSAADIAKIIREQMREWWDEICYDTDCHPMDIVHEHKGKLSYSASHWTDFIADHSAREILALTPDATQTREAELVAALNEIADLGSCANGKTPAYKLFQQAIDIATGAL